MIDESEQILDDLLSRWHGWARGGGDGCGYPAVSAGFGQYTCSRQYDDCNGALDTDIECQIMQGVDFAIQSVDQPHRTALYLNARNLYTGVHVWASARLPPDPEVRAVIVMEARAKLLVLLGDGGLV